MLGRDQMVQDVIDYLSSVTDATIISALSARGLTVTRAPDPPSAPADIRVKASVKLVSVTGEPISRVKVSVTPIVSNFSVTSNTGETFYPCLSDIPVHQYTDANGQASFELIKGSSVRVMTSLSAATREVLVPTSPFDLLDAQHSAGIDYLSDPVIPRVPLLRSDI